MKQKAKKNNAPGQVFFANLYLNRAEDTDVHHIRDVIHFKNFYKNLRIENS